MIVAEGGEPLWALGTFNAESNLATNPDSKTVRYQLYNPGATRSTTIEVGEEVKTDNGIFIRYPDWASGFRDMPHRLPHPDKPYHKLPYTIENIVPHWAPVKDGNSPESYIKRVVDFMNKWREEPPVVPNPVPAPAETLRVALAAGHHNTSGGNRTEYGITGELTEAYARAFRRLGADVRVITPDGPDEDGDPGDGDFPGNLSQAAYRVVEWANAGWVAHLFLEVHTEGAGGVRGVFSIYPDWTGDRDVDSIELGKRMVAAIDAATDLKQRGSGLMSEKDTGVGAQGSRLGVFRVTEAVKAVVTRMIIEHGAHDNQADLEIIRRSDFNDKVANAAAPVVFDYFKVETKREGVRFFDETGKELTGGFRTRWEAAGDTAPAMYGYPDSNEFDYQHYEKQGAAQVFQRAVFFWDSATPAGNPFHIEALMPHDAAWVRRWARDRGLLREGAGVE